MWAGRAVRARRKDRRRGIRRISGSSSSRRLTQTAPCPNPQWCCQRKSNRLMTNIVVPTLGESVVEARVARWLKHEGDRVEVGDPLVELETEKIDLEVNAEKGGVITSIKHPEGD